jgi:outer membrane protein assembly factor BamD
MKLTRTIFAAMMIVVIAACHHNSAARRPTRPAVDAELLHLTKDQLFQHGEDTYAKKRWAKARTYYSYVYENFPNDPLGRRSLLRVADTYFQQGTPVNLVEAQYKYRDFINRYPGSDRADYAMLQIAMVSYKQMERPDRDQTKTHEALDKFNDMIAAYPRSALRVDADKYRTEAVDRLARHEHLIARFYKKRKSYNAAALRLNNLVEQYPNYSDRVGVFYDLGETLRSLGRKGEARLYFERVIAEFPKSELAGKAKHQLDMIKA